jgi:hypothetical protein
VADTAPLLLLQRLPFLTRLKLSINGDEILERAMLAGGFDAAAIGGGGADAAVAISRMLPASVTALHLICLGEPAFLLNVVSHLSQLRELTFECAAMDSEGIDLSPLQRLPLLNTLTLLLCHLNKAAALVLASLASLEALHVGYGDQWEAELLDALTDSAHCRLARLRTLQLHECHITPAHMQALARLPSLDELVCNYFAPTALPHLSSLRSLTSLGCSMHDADSGNVVAAAPILPQLSGCAQLVKLELCYFSFTDADLQALSAALPQLQICSFTWDRLPPLTALKQFRQLRELNIWKCRYFSLADLLPLDEVASLRALQVDLLPTEHAAARQLMESASFRHLEQFDISNLNE